MSSKEILDKVITSVPIDSTAGRVTSRGVQYESPKVVTCKHSEVALPLRDIPAASNFPDMTGKQFGRLTVVGLYAERRKDRSKPSSLWVVRCSCGKYETRKTKAIKNQNNFDDRCAHCQHLEHLKRKTHFRMYDFDKERE